ncbi:DNA adenine methylase [Veronia nyctiphanis]|uniref:DNA adenine methylase n=1 Tax=Veronia nyctiphanis TaxID=1278244 RepID=UPI00191C1F60|nr:DNA adenine methylase [Veronia nyctiphanis]
MQDCIARYDSPETVFYLDPPYWGTTGYGEAFSFDNYVRMAELAQTSKGKFVISINDHPEIREVFEGLTCHNVSITYTVGGSHNAAKRDELIFTSK